MLAHTYAVQHPGNLVHSDINAAALGALLKNNSMCRIAGFGSSKQT